MLINANTKYHNQICNIGELFIDEFYFLDEWEVCSRLNDCVCAAQMRFPRDLKNTAYEIWRKMHFVIGKWYVSVYYPSGRNQILFFF